MSFRRESAPVQERTGTSPGVGTDLRRGIADESCQADAKNGMLARKGFQAQHPMHAICLQIAVQQLLHELPEPRERDIPIRGSMPADGLREVISLEPLRRARSIDRRHQLYE